MKTKSLLILPVLFLAIFLVSCKKDNPAPAAGTIFDAASLSSGTWSITSFTQRAENKTSDYAGMDFAFSNDGKVAVTGTKNTNGTWSYSAPVPGYYGSPSSLATFTINIAGSDFSKLSRAWNVGANTATSMQLNHPEAAEDEHMTFTKK